MERLKKITNRQAFISLFIIGLVVYFQVFFNGFVGDDKEQIYNVALVKNFLTLPKVFLYHHVVLGQENSLLSGYYKPLMLFYFYAIRGIFGIHPFFYHAPQVVLFIINSFLVFLLFTKFLKRNVAFLFAVLFLIHPINQETVAYASNIQDVLFFFFGMSALLICLKQKLTGKKLLVINVLLLLSLLSKENGILFVAIIPLYFFFFRREFLKKIIFVEGFTLVFYFLLRFSSHATNAFWIEPPPMAGLPIMQRLLHIPLIFFYYIKTFFYPDILSFNQQWVIKNFNVKTFFLPFLVDIGILSLLFVALFKMFQKKIEAKTTLLFFTIWFLLGLLPHLQILPLDATVATRWFYFSSVGAIGVLALGYSFIELLFKRYSKFLFICAVALLFILSIRTMTRNIQWKDALTLYSTDYAISQSALLTNNLGNEYFEKGNIDTANIYFKKALLLNPNLWIALNNLGIVQEKKGNFDKAYFYYNSSLQKGARLPMYENIARILVFQKKDAEAISFTKNALIKYPQSATLWLTLSLAYYELERYKEALPFAEKSYSISPELKTQNVVSAIYEKIRNVK